MLALVGGPLLVAGGWLTLHTFASYRSPFSSRLPEPRAPRAQALLDLAEAERRRAAAAARRAELLANMTTPAMVDLGREIVHGRGLCFNCHRIGTEGRGFQGPDLQDVGARAASRVPGLGDVEYLTQSLYRPDAYIVDGYVPAMTPADEAPINLDQDEILWVVAYLQSLGGTATVTPETRLEIPR